MQIRPTTIDRRRFLSLTASFSTGALLTGCGSGGPTGDTIVVVPAPTAAAPVAALPSDTTHPLNLALNLAYIGAQYYGYAARGSGLPTALTGGIDRPGEATGARQASFSGDTTATYAAELADDKQRHVVALREQIGVLAASQPALDLSAVATGAFSIAAQGAGIVGSGSAFDPYANDESFLLGAFLIENVVAAAYRTQLTQTGDPATAAIVAPILADAIYHGGLIRALLDDKATTNPSVANALTNASLLLGVLDGSNVGDQTLSGASGISSNLLDAEGRPIPFTRATPQILKSLYLSSTGIGGFLPAGANGVSA